MNTPEALRVFKVDRANYHLNELNRTVQRWIDGHSKPVILKPDPDVPGNYLVIFESNPFPSHDVSMIIGDILQNLRSALDHLVVALTLRYSDLRFSDVSLRDCQFPIIGDINKKGVSGTGPGIWEHSALPKMIRGISPEAQRVIKGLQPYQRGTDYLSHPLWVLNEFANRDKHRVLSVAGAVGGELRIFPDSLVNCRINGAHTIFGAHVMEGETVMATIPIVPIDPTKGMQMDVRPGIQVVLLEFPNRLDAIGMLEVIRDYITEEVIPALEPYLR